jgi:hypothetical protein
MIGEKLTFFNILISIESQLPVVRRREPEKGSQGARCYLYCEVSKVFL